MNVLVVDDESIMREAFSRLFDWERYGLTHIGQAKNGKEALHIIKEQEVDIVVTDLKMPVMDGLTLIAEAQKIKPALKFVVMSAYDTFDLVNEAYKLGIKDYFLKFDFDADKVLSLLSRIAEEIIEERSRAKRGTELAEKLQRFETVMSENEQVLREQMLKKVLWSGKDDKKLTKQLSDSGISLSLQNLGIMVIILDNYYEVEKREWQDERELLKFGILNIVEEILQGFKNVYAFCNMPHEYVILYSSDREKYDDGVETKLFSVLQSKLKECFGFVVSGGISENRNGFKKTLSLYHQAKSACEYTFIKGTGNLIKYNEITEKITNMQLDTNEKAEDFKKFMSKLRDSQQLRNSIAEFQISRNKVQPQNAVAVRELFYIYYYEIFSYIKQNNLSDRKELCEQTDYFIKNLQKSGTLPQLNECLKATLELLAREMEQTDFVSEARRYINLNYQRDISLGDISEYLGISESYLSRMFKRETGENLSEYISHVRIDRAVELMKTRRFKVYEIAEQVGFRNVEYFSRQFKKITGKSPSEY